MLVTPVARRTFDKDGKPTTTLTPFAGQIPAAVPELKGALAK